MRRFSLVALIIFLCFIIAGCASFKKAMSETTPEQVTQMQATIAPAVAAIPAPYSIPTGTLLLPIAGYLAAVAKNWAKNWWANKTAPKTSTA